MSLWEGIAKLKEMRDAYLDMVEIYKEISHNVFELRFALDYTQEDECRILFLIQEKLKTKIETNHNILTGSSNFSLSDEVASQEPVIGHFFQYFKEDFEYKLAVQEKILEQLNFENDLAENLDILYISIQQQIEEATEFVELSGRMMAVRYTHFLFVFLCTILKNTKQIENIEEDRRRYVTFWVILGGDDD